MTQEERKNKAIYKWLLLESATMIIYKFGILFFDQKIILKHSVYLSLIFLAYIIIRCKIFKLQIKSCELMTVLNFVSYFLTKDFNFFLS